jgi:hypothetical protein
MWFVTRYGHRHEFGDEAVMTAFVTSDLCSFPQQGGTGYPVYPGVSGFSRFFFVTAMFIPVPCPQVFKDPSQVFKDPTLE